MKYLVLIIKGMIYGVVHIIPGLGGGIMLILLGIYEQFVDAVGNFFIDLRHWKEHLALLIPVGVGMVAGMVGLSKIMTLLLERYNAQVMIFFMGLLLGTIPSVLKMHGDMRLTLGRAVAFALGLGVVVAVGLATPAEGEHSSGMSVAALSTPGGIAYNTFISFLGGGASVTPGLDGSYVLILGRTYQPILEAFGELSQMVIRWGILASTGIGAVAGIFIFSKVTDTLIKRAPSLVYYAVLGLISGSVFGLWPRDLADMGGGALAILAALGIVGFALAYFFSRLESRAEASHVASAQQVL